MKIKFGKKARFDIKGQAGLVTAAIVLSLEV
jgi:hypothetical protein